MRDRITANLPARSFDETAAFYGALGFAVAFRDGGWIREGRLQDYFAVNQDIYSLIVESSGNRTLTEVHRSLSARAQWARLRALSSHGRWAESADEHRALLAALEARDPARAAKVAHDHVLRTGEVIAVAIDPRKPRAERLGVA